MRRDTKVARRTPGRTAETADTTGRQAQCRDSDVWPRVSLASAGRPDVWADAGAVRSVSSEGSRPPAPMGARLVRSAERPERGGWGPRRRGSSVRTLTATPARVSGLPARPAGFGPGRRHREARSSRKPACTAHMCTHAHRAARPTGSARLTGGKGCDPERERGPGRAVSSHARPGSRPPRRELRNAPASWSNCARVSHS